MVKVSIIIPTYNYGTYICEGIDSLLQQKYPQHLIEIIVIDDGSTDDTPRLLERYGDRIKYVYQKNQGVGCAVKKGIEIAGGKYLFVLDPDDLYLPHKIATVVGVYEQYPEVVHVAHPVIKWSVDLDIKEPESIPQRIRGRVINGKELTSYFYTNACFYGGGSTISGRSEIWKNIDINSGITMFIDEYLALFSLNQGSAYICDEPLSLYRIHGQNESVKSLKLKIEKDLRINRTILEMLNRYDFDADIKLLYGLKTIMTELRSKEESNQKSFGDVLAMWKYLFKNTRAFRGRIIRIMCSYRMLQRSFPASFIKIKRRFKRLAAGKEGRSA